MGNNNRVNRIKFFLIVGPYIIVLIPIILCIVLMLMMSGQSKQIRQMQDKIDVVNEDRGAVWEQVSELTDRTVTLTHDIEELNINIANIKSNMSADDLINHSDEWPQKVYLTFDDGPSSNTEKILDILRKYDVKATFFVVGTQNDSLRKYYKKIVDEGHTLGMHSYSHKYSEIYVSEDAFIRDLDRISDLIYEETGVRSKVYRFPGGSSNSVSRVPMSKLEGILADRGIDYYDWNIVSGDATNPAPSTEEIIENSLNGIEKYKEAMILFHDLANKTTTVEALPRIIQELKDRGITIAPIDEDTMLIQHNVNNK